MQGTRRKAQGSSPHSSFIISSFVILFLFSFSLYAFTLAPGLLLADAGEFQVVGATLGIAHPPGFALYTLLSWLTTRWLFFLPPATAVNFLSALLAALAVTLTARIVQRATGSLSAGLGAALVLAFSTTFWSQATTANVRMLAAFAVTWALERLLAYRFSLTAENAVHAEKNSPPALLSPQTLRLSAAAFALGLSVSHHASTIFIAAILGLYALWLNPSILRRPWPMLMGLVPFLAWLYFPLRGPAMGLPRLATLDGFLEHVLARGFAGDILAFATWKDLPGRFLAFSNILTFEFVWPALVFAALGGAAALYRDRPFGVALLAAWAVHSFIAITYRAPQTVEYLLPAYVLMAVAIGFGLDEIGKLTTKNTQAESGAAHTPTRPHSSQPTHSHALIPPRSFVTLSLALAVLAPQFAATFPSYRLLARDDSTHEFVETALAASDPGAVLLTSWHWANALTYVQKIEGVRPDVEVRYVAPHGASYAQNWAEAIAADAETRPVTVTNFYEQEYAALPYRFVPFGPVWGVRTQPVTTPPADFGPGQSFGEWKFLRYDIQSQTETTAVVTTVWQPTGAPHDVNFYVHLLGADGQLYGQMDVSHPAARYVTGEALIDRYTIEIRPDAPPGDYTLAAGVYTGNGARLVDVPLTTIHLGPLTFAPVTLHPLFHRFGAAALIGYDVDHTLPDSPRAYLHWHLGRTAETVSVLGSTLALPAGPGYRTTTLDLAPGEALDITSYERPDGSPLHIPAWDLGPGTSLYMPLGNSVLLTGVEFTPRQARPGDSINFTLHFLSARPLAQDISVGLALTGDGWRAQSDGTPVGGAIPTLKWITGSRLTDRRTLTVPAQAAPGSAQLTLVLYDAFTQQKLALLDPRLARLGPSVPLGQVEIVPH